MSRVPDRERRTKSEEDLRPVKWSEMIRSGCLPGNRKLSPKIIKDWLELLGLAFQNANAFYSGLLVALVLDITLTISGQSIIDVRGSDLSEISLGAASMCGLFTLFFIGCSPRIVKCVLSIREIASDRVDRFLSWLFDTPDARPQPPCEYTVPLDYAERHARKTANAELTRKINDARASHFAKQNVAFIGARLSAVCLILVVINFCFPDGTFSAAGEYRNLLGACLAFIAAVPLLKLRRRHIQGDGRIECPELARKLTLEWYARQGRVPPGLAYRAGLKKTIERMNKPADL